MIDRFVFNASKQKVESFFDVSSKRDDYFAPDYNISPGALRPIIIREKKEAQNELKQAQWGLIPPNAEEERAGKQHVIIPSEKVLKDDWTAECAHQRRCLIPANGFYKWKTSQKETTPFYIRLLSNKLTAFAGVYGVWKSSSGREVYSFAILTTTANTLVEPVDNRMPVLLKPSDFDRWLSQDELTEKMQRQLLTPFDLTEMAVNRVSEQVNDINNHGPDLIQPIPK